MFKAVENGSKKFKASIDIEEVKPDLNSIDYYLKLEICQYLDFESLLNCLLLNKT